MSYVYLASPYTHIDPKVREERYCAALNYTTDRTEHGEVIFSPIVHSHPMALLGLRGDWDFWQHIDRTFIDNCARLRVLQIDGWEQSVGVRAEIEYASALGKEIEYASV